MWTLVWTEVVVQPFLEQSQRSYGYQQTRSVDETSSAVAY